MSSGSGEVVADGVRVPPRGRAAEPSVALRIRAQVKGERAFQTGRATAAHVDARRRGAELRTGNPAHASGPLGRQRNQVARRTVRVRGEAGILAGSRRYAYDLVEIRDRSVARRIGLGVWDTGLVKK